MFFDLEIVVVDFLSEVEDIAEHLEAKTRHATEQVLSQRILIKSRDISNAISNVAFVISADVLPDKRAKVTKRWEGRRELRAHRLKIERAPTEDIIQFEQDAISVGARALMVLFIARHGLRIITFSLKTHGGKRRATLFYFVRRFGWVKNNDCCWKINTLYK